MDKETKQKYKPGEVLKNNPHLETKMQIMQALFHIANELATLNQTLKNKSQGKGSNWKQKNKSFASGATLRKGPRGGPPG